MFFPGDIVITDPCYIVKNSADWSDCGYGQALDALGISTFLSTGEEWAITGEGNISFRTEPR